MQANAANNTVKLGHRHWSDGNGSDDLIETQLAGINNPSSPYNRVYATDHFDPQIWGFPQAYLWLSLQARRYVKDNYERDLLKAPGLRPPGRWKIRFSAEILEAITVCLENIRIFRDAAKKTHTRSRGPSVTPFDDTDEGSPPHESMPGIPVFEIARILMWEPQALIEQDCARVLLGMHAMFNIPLFFVPRSWVASHHPSLLENELLIFAEPKHTRNSRAEDLGGSFWPHSETPNPKSFRYAAGRPIDDFCRLLECPMILFAADAVEIIKDKCWSAYCASHGISDS